MILAGLFLFLKPFISEYNVKLFYNFFFSTPRIELPNIDTCFTIVVAVLAMMNHIETSIVELEVLLKQNTVRHLSHYQN